MPIPISLNDFANVSLNTNQTPQEPKNRQKKITKLDFLKENVIPFLEIAVLCSFLIMVIVFSVLCVIGNIEKPTESVKGFIAFINNNWKGSLFVVLVLLYRPIILKIEQLKKIDLDKKILEFLKDRK